MQRLQGPVLEAVANTDRTEVQEGGVYSVQERELHRETGDQTEEE